MIDQCKSADNDTSSSTINNETDTKQDEEKGEEGNNGNSSIDTNENVELERQTYVAEAKVCFLIIVFLFLVFLPCLMLLVPVPQDSI